MESSSFDWFGDGVPDLWPGHTVRETQADPLGIARLIIKGGKSPEREERDALNREMEAWITLILILKEMWPYFVFQVSKTGHVDYRSVFPCYYILFINMYILKSHNPNTFTKLKVTYYVIKWLEYHLIHHTPIAGNSDPFLFHHI